MSLTKWNVSLSGLALILSTLGAHGQEAKLAGSVATKTEHAGKFTRACAERDLRLVTAIEGHAAAGDVDGQKLFAAYRTLMDARRACREGREGEALARYDGAALIAVPTHAAR